MKARRKAPDSNTPHRLTGWSRWALWLVFGAGGACVFVMMSVGLWFQSSLNRFKSLEARTKTAYERLNTDFPFAVVEGAGVSSDRIASYLRVREAVIHAIPRVIDEKMAAFLRSGTVRRFELLRLFSAEAEAIRLAAEAHIAMLRSEEMSLNEYLWLHGAVVREIFRNGDPRREEFQKIVLGLDRIFSTSDWIEGEGFSPEAFERGLEVAYHDLAALPAESIAPMRVKGSAAGVIDVLAANRTQALNAHESDNSGS